MYYHHHARDTLYNGVYVVYMANIQYVYTAAHHLMPACVYCVYRYHIQYLLYINVLFLYTMLYMWCTLSTHHCLLIHIKKYYTKKPLQLPFNHDKTLAYKNTITSSRMAKMVSGHNNNSRHRSHSTSRSLRQKRSWTPQRHGRLLKRSKEVTISVLWFFDDTVCY